MPNEFDWGDRAQLEAVPRKKTLAKIRQRTALEKAHDEENACPATSSTDFAPERKS